MMLGSPVLSGPQCQTVVPSGLIVDLASGTVQGRCGKGKEGLEEGRRDCMIFVKEQENKRRRRGRERNCEG